MRICEGPQALYAGLLLFARLIRAVEHPGRMTVLTIGLAVVVAMSGAAIVQAQDPTAHVSGLLAIGYAIFQAVVLGVTAVVALRVKHRAGPLYTPALAWIFVAVVISCIALLNRVYYP